MAKKPVKATISYSGWPQGKIVLSERIISLADLGRLSQAGYHVYFRVFKDGLCSYTYDLKPVRKS